MYSAIWAKADRRSVRSVLLVALAMALVGTLYVPAQAQTGGARRVLARALRPTGRGKDASTVRQGTLGRLSSFHRCNHSELTLFDPDLIPLQHLVEGNANVGATGSVLNGSNVNLGEVAVGLLPKLFTDLIHNIFHIHYDLTHLFCRRKAPL